MRNLGVSVGDGIMEVLPEEEQEDSILDSSSDSEAYNGSSYSQPESIYNDSDWSESDAFFGVDLEDVETDLIE